MISAEPSEYALDSAHLRAASSPRGLFAANRCSNENHCIIKWWELRRIQYNAIMLVIGVPSVLVYWNMFSKYAADPADDGIFPGLMPIFVGLVANFFYTSGWITECAVRALKGKGAPKLGPILFALGLVFSIFVVSLPAISALELTSQMHRAHLTHWP